MERVWTTVAIMILTNTALGQGGSQGSSQGGSQGASDCGVLTLDSPPQKKEFAAFAKDTYEQIKQMEEAFFAGNRSLFMNIVHPALRASLAGNKQDPFQETVYEFGLKNAKLTRTTLYLARFGEGTPEVLCQFGTLRGVVGPKLQIAAIHQTLGTRDQIRIVTLWAPVLDSQKTKAKFDKESGLVMLQAQNWSLGGKTLTSLIEDTKKWNVLQETTLSFVSLSAAKKLGFSNPYYTPQETGQLAQLEKEVASKLNLSEFKSRIQALGTEAQFIDLESVFKADRIEPSLRFRYTSSELSGKAYLELCKKVSQAVTPLLSPAFRKEFNGIECLGFSPQEDIQLPPSQGSQFFNWNELK
jgi:hypothetical protein